MFEPPITRNAASVVVFWNPIESTVVSSTLMSLIPVSRWSNVRFRMVTRRQSTRKIWAAEPRSNTRSLHPRSATKGNPLTVLLVAFTDRYSFNVSASIQIPLPVSRFPVAVTLTFPWRAMPCSLFVSSFSATTMSEERAMLIP